GPRRPRHILHLLPDTGLDRYGSEPALDGVPSERGDAARLAGRNRSRRHCGLAAGNEVGRDPARRRLLARHPSLLGRPLAGDRLRGDPGLAARQRRLLASAPAPPPPPPPLP